MNDYLAAILFFLPAGIGNATPVLLNKIPVINTWGTPLDFGKSWRGQRILGNNKRLRGLVFGALLGGLSAVIVSKLNVNTVVNLAPFWVGCLLGFGALIGDAIESFFKRQQGFKPGQSWFPFDQIDYIVGALVICYPFVHLPLWVMLTIFVVYFGLHLVITYLAYLLGLKDKPI